MIDYRAFGAESAVQRAFAEAGKVGDDVHRHIRPDLGISVASDTHDAVRVAGRISAKGFVVQFVRQLEATLDTNHCAADELSGAHLLEHLNHILDGDVVDDVRKMPRLARAAQRIPQFAASSNGQLHGVDAE